MQKSAITQLNTDATSPSDCPENTAEKFKADHRFRPLFYVKTLFSIDTFSERPPQVIDKVLTIWSDWDRQSLVSDHS